MSTLLTVAANTMYELFYNNKLTMVLSAQTDFAVNSKNFGLNHRREFIRTIILSVYVKRPVFARCPRFSVFLLFMTVLLYDHRKHDRNVLHLMALQHNKVTSYLTKLPVLALMNLFTCRSNERPRLISDVEASAVTSKSAHTQTNHMFQVALCIDISVPR